MDKEAVVVLVTKFAADLDAGDTSSISTVAASLDGLEVVELIPVLKAHLGIERIVKNNLDEHEQFGKLLTRISKEYEAINEQGKDKDTPQSDS